MPAITALIHTRNDALRIGRALESLRPCDELLVIDHGSADHTVKLAREHGARVLGTAAGPVDAAHDWLLCLRPSESLTEALEASLFEWKQSDPGAAAFAVAVREEVEGGWRSAPPETRLVDRRRLTWSGPLPPSDSAAALLRGDLMRFRHP